jgi:lysyl-tRNA synthetase class 2
VIGIIDQGEETGYILQDDSGRVVVRAHQYPRVGSLIEQQVLLDERGQVFPVGMPQLLADCEDFYISQNSSPNYKKMVIDENLREKLLMRGKVLAAIRDFFLARDFVEADTPCLVRLPGMEPYLDVFRTRLEAQFTEGENLSEEMYLITSPEYAMKKLLAGGLEKIFQLTRSFRNKETFSERHNPEFTILEWYRAYASYLEMMDDTEALVKYVWEKLGPKNPDGSPAPLLWHGREIQITVPWSRLSVPQAFREMAGVDEETFFSEDKLRAEVKRRGYPCGPGSRYDDLFFSIFMNEIEPKLGMDVPAILYDYPLSMAALSKPSAADSRLAERFEAYIGGLELCNAFSELNDPVEQESRLQAEREERRALGRELYEVDQTFIEALKFGMPPSGGNALGVDRLMMLVTGESDIRNVLFFPQRDL